MFSADRLPRRVVMRENAEDVINADIAIAIVVWVKMTRLLEYTQ